MANVPRTNIQGITDAEGLLSQLFSYLNTLQGQQAAPQVNAAPWQGVGLNKMLFSLNHAPMQLMPGGGIDPAMQSDQLRTANRLAAQPARQQIGLQRQGSETDIMGQNLNLQQGNLFNNMSMQQMIDQYMSGISGQLGQIGQYPPYLRGMAQGTAAAGTGSGGGIFGGLI